MAISYPLSLPDTFGFRAVKLRQVVAATADMSPFTFSQQVVSWPGERWEADVSLPSDYRGRMAPWKAFLLSLRGPVGTFLMGDPDYQTPQGTVSDCLVSGAAGEASVTVVMTGSLLAGDYIQLGAGASARLHCVLQDQDGSGTLDIWPALRRDYNGAPATFENAMGVFRLTRPVTEWEIDTAGIYGLSFQAVEAIG